MPPPPVERESIQASKPLKATSILWGLAALCIVSAGLLFSAGFAAAGGSQLGAALGALSLLVALTFFCSAGLVGFLFGVPRNDIINALPRGSLSTASEDGTRGNATGRFSSNSNLAEISDWLTKILVGLGLIQLPTVPSILQRLGDRLASAYVPRLTGAMLASEEIIAVLAICAVVLFSCLGFVAGYFFAQMALAAPRPTPSPSEAPAVPAQIAARPDESVRMPEVISPQQA